MNKQRKQKLMPNNIPRYIRCYDNQGETLDRYTVVFTGNYRHNTGGDFIYLGMNSLPFDGIGQHGFSDCVIDKPKYSHLGKKITFDSLPKDCKTLVIQDYKELWNL